MVRKQERADKIKNYCETCDVKVEAKRPDGYGTQCDLPPPPPDDSKKHVGDPDEMNPVDSLAIWVLDNSR